MNPSQIGLYGGILGAFLGILGGIFGTYMSIKNAKSPAEKALIVKTSIGIWVLFIFLVVVPIILTTMKIIPRWVPFAGLGLIWIVITPIIIGANKKQMYIEDKEKTEK